MTKEEYQAFTVGRLNGGFDSKETQFTGLVAEVGELMSERMRELRDDREAKGTEEVLSELGDILFYLTNIAHMYDYTLSEVMDYNVNKLTNRKAKKH